MSQKYSCFHYNFSSCKRYNSTAYRERKAALVKDQTVNKLISNNMYTAEPSRPNLSSSPQAAAQYIWLSLNTS